MADERMERVRNTLTVLLDVERQANVRWEGGLYHTVLHCFSPEVLRNFGSPDRIARAAVDPETWHHTFALLCDANCMNRTGAVVDVTRLEMLLAHFDKQYMVTFAEDAERVPRHCKNCELWQEDGHCCEALGKSGSNPMMHRAGNSFCCFSVKHDPLAHKEPEPWPEWEGLTSNQQNYFVGLARRIAPGSMSVLDEAGMAREAPLVFDLYNTCRNLMAFSLSGSAARIRWDSTRRIGIALHPQWPPRLVEIGEGGLAEATMTFNRESEAGGVFNVRFDEKGELVAEAKEDG